MVYESTDTLLPTVNLRNPTIIHIDDSFDTDLLKLDIGPCYWIFSKSSGKCVEAGHRRAPTGT
ncbi:hypothetical protein LCGC14_2864100 [marine sediment metagenome]|uniref:Uncharacterized protein n=1 Tax=marine sediment metagenome TaxID=412755 RepID=A0A0F8YRL4_9ZZZZ